MIEKAKRTISSNIVQTADGPMLAAGGGHFRSLWVRDFCFSVPGLLIIGNQELVRNQLMKIYSVKAENGWLPRGLDVVNPKLRVVWNIFLSRDPSFMRYENRILKPEYLGEHKTPAYDSNLLFILASKQFERHTGTALLTNEQLQNLLKVYKFDREGLLHQPAFSDWQDSARREGPILLTHLYYWKAALELELHQVADDVAHTINRTFFKKGRYCERPKGDQVSLDSQLFILTSQLPLENLNYERMYRDLKSSALWKKMIVPGVPIHPAYKASDISWTQKIIGLKNYHDGFVWGWLAAEAVKCAKFYGDQDEARRITDIFARSNERDQYLSEIYSAVSPDMLMPSRSKLYKSEAPFSWTAAKWLEALS